jgi:predicted dehydrogenase
VGRYDLLSREVPRRSFLNAGAVAGAVLPYVVPRRALGFQGQTGANGRIRIGVIGVGNRGNLLIDQLPEEAEVVAVADCFLRKCADAAAKRQTKWRMYTDYREMLDTESIDGVIVATNEHNHVLPSIHACMAGKDVYVEKPMSLYLREGRVLVAITRKYKRIVQVGSQQRSMAMNQLGCDFVRKGSLGNDLFVEGTNYSSPRFPSPQSPPTQPPVPVVQPVPEGVNWDMYIGQCPMRPYGSRIGGWEFAGGEMTNWGPHGLDQVQSALGKDETGPTEFWPLLEDGPKNSLAFRYANGVTVRLVMPTGDLQGGAMFVGDKARIEIIRNNFRTDPPRLVKELPPPEEVQKWRDDVALWQAKYHMQDWLNCMRTRKPPLADVEIGHRSVSVCHLANITRRLGRRLKWDPAGESFIGDPEADGLLTRTRRKGYELPPAT